MIVHASEKLRTHRDPKPPHGTHSFAATGCPGGAMITDQFWRPDKQTRSAIRRGDRLYREYLARKRQEYERALIERLLAHQDFKEAI